MGFKAINEAENVDDANTLDAESYEARENRLVQNYESALRMVGEGTKLQALEAFTRMQDHELIKAAEDPSTNPTHIVVQLRALVLRNKAELLAEDDKTAEAALQLYLEALKWDTGDPALWHRTGCLAAELGEWGMARLSLEQGLQCSPQHVLIAEKLLEVLLHIGDYVSADGAAAYLLKIHPDHPRASQLSICLRGIGASVETSSGPDGPEFDGDNAGEILTPRFPGRLRHRSSGSYNSDAEDVRIDLPEPSWTALLDGLAESIQAGDVMSRKLRVTVKGDSVEHAMRLHQSAAEAAGAAETMQTDPSANPGDSSAAGKPQSQRAGKEMEAAMCLSDGPGQECRNTPPSGVGEAQEAAAKERRPPDTKMGSEETQAAAGGQAAGNRSRASKRLVERRAKGEDEGEVVGDGDGKRNVIATLSPFIGQRQGTLLQPSPLAAAPGAEESCSQALPAFASEASSVLGFLSCQSGASLMAMAENALRLLSGVSPEKKLPEGTPRKMAELDVVMRGKNRLRTGWERPAGSALLMAEMHLDRALALINEEKASKKAGMTSPNSLAISQHLQANQRNLGAFALATLGAQASPTVQLRYFWAQARHAEQNNKDDRATLFLEACESLCSREGGGGDAPSGPDSSGSVRRVVLVNCAEDNVISWESLLPRLRHTQFLARMEQAQAQLTAGDPHAAVEELAPSCLTGVHCDLDRGAHVRALRLLKDALNACNSADLLALELHAGLLYIVRKLRAVPVDIEDVHLHSALPRGRNPPRGVNLTTESKKGAKPSLRSEDLLSVAAAADRLAALAREGRSVPAPPGLKAQAPGSESIQELLRVAQWKLLAYAERCYWTSPATIQSSHRDAGYREVLAATLAALCSLQQLELSAPSEPGRVYSMLSSCMELLNERRAASALNKFFPRYCQQRLQASLAQQRAARSKQSEGEEREESKTEEDIESALAQCVYILYGLSFEHRDETWGGGKNLERKDEQAALSSVQSCKDVWPYICSYAESLKDDPKKLARLRDKLDIVSERFPVPSDAMLELGPVLHALKGSEVSLEDLIHKPRPDFAHMLLASPQALADKVAADPDADIRSSLYNLQLQVEAQHLNLSKSILRGNGKAALDRVVRLASCDLCYNPHRYSTWDILAQSYRKAHLSLLDELCYEASPSEEAVQLGRDLRQRALRSTLIARQLVPLGEEQEVSYCEEELGLFLLQEVRDLPPEAGRLPADDAEQRQWNCREAAQAFMRAAATLPEEWQFQHQLGKALEKRGAPAAEYLQKYARACCYATVLAGGRLEPLYRLHASRLKLLKQGSPGDMAVIRRFCFLEETAERLPGLMAGVKRSRETSNEGTQYVLPVKRQKALDGLPNGTLRAKNAGCLAATSPSPQEQVEEELLARDCVAALQFCLDRSKGFHKARYRLAKAYDEFEGDMEKAAEEMRHLFGKQRKLFAIAVESLTDTDSQEYGTSKDMERLDTKQAPSMDESLWGRKPAKVTGTGVSEEWRKHLSSVRKYLAYYLRLLAATRDARRLQAAVHALRSATLQAQYPSFTDIVRLAVGLLVFCLAWQLSTLLPTAFEEGPPHPPGQVPSAAGSMTLIRSLTEDEASLLEAAFLLVAEHSLQIEGAKQKWSEAILPALHAAAGDMAATVHLGAEHPSEEAFLHYAKAYILHLEKAGESERLAAIATKVLKPTVLRRLKAAEAEQPLLCALARACSTTMAACMAQVDMACAMRMQAAEEAEIGKKRRLEATPDPEGVPPSGSQQPLQSAPSLAVSAEESEEPVNDAAGGEDESPKRTRGEQPEAAQRTSRSPVPAAKRRALHHPPEAPTPENPVSALAAEAFKRLRLLLTLYKASEQLLPSKPVPADAQEDRAGRDSILVGAVVAYIHMMHGKDTQLAPMGAKEAEAICMELLKQAGRGGAAPLPILAGRLASDAPQVMRESPPSPKDWHATAEACEAPVEGGDSMRGSQPAVAVEQANGWGLEERSRSEECPCLQQDGGGSDDSVGEGPSAPESAVPPSSIPRQPQGSVAAAVGNPSADPSTSRLQAAGPQQGQSTADWLMTSLTGARSAAFPAPSSLASLLPALSSRGAAPPFVQCSGDGEATPRKGAQRRPAVFEY